MTTIIKQEYSYFRSRDFELQLQDTKGTENLGVVFLTATLWPRTQQDKEQVSIYRLRQNMWRIFKQVHFLFSITRKI